MKKLLLLSIVLMLGLGLYAGTPHTVIWQIDGAPPVFEFTAYIDIRPGEILTETSTGSVYQGGFQAFQVGNFATQWSPGETVVLLNECTDEPLDFEGLEMGILTTAGFDNFGLYLLDPCVTPVELTAFQAVMQEEFAAISWITETYSDLAYFEIYRDDIEIHSIELDEPNSSQTSEFTFIDEEVVDGETYVYDLNAVNLDGTSFTIGSTTLTIVIEPPDEFSNVTALYNNYPNPFKGTTAIKYAVKEGMTASLTIYNAKGQIVDTYTLGQTGVNGAEQVWNADTSGIYFYKLESEGVSQVKKMLVLK